MATFALQYLEDRPGIGTLAVDDVRARLRAACAELPISLVLLGWNVPPVLVHACGDEAARAGAQLYRWHPLLTGDGTFLPRPEWQTIGLNGDPVPGFRGRPEFTFVCPNRPAARQAALDHLHDVLQGGDYSGVFLDRMRYPSPAADPARLLSCFCEECRYAAAAEGFDLEAARRLIRKLAATPDRAASLVRSLLDPLTPATDPTLAALRGFLDFRAHSITQFIQSAVEVIHAEGLAVGLDCFSPALAYMVGQNLHALDCCCEWVKIMSYGHALGPASLPFELLDLASWLMDARLASEAQALSALSEATSLSLPSTRAELRGQGLYPEALGSEVRRARTAGVTTLLAGIELVEIEGVTRLHQAQIAADLRAFRAAGADGLALSWDLWYIPLKRLKLVREVWSQEENR